MGKVRAKRLLMTRVRSLSVGMKVTLGMTERRSDGEVEIVVRTISEGEGKVELGVFLGYPIPGHVEGLLWLLRESGAGAPRRGAPEGILSLLRGSRRSGGPREDSPSREGGLSEGPSPPEGGGGGAPPEGAHPIRTAAWGSAKTLRELGFSGEGEGVAIGETDALGRVVFSDLEKGKTYLVEFIGAGQASEGARGEGPEHPEMLEALGTAFGAVDRGIERARRMAAAEEMKRTSPDPSVGPWRWGDAFRADFRPLILVADDDEGTCEAIKEALKLRGYAVHTVQRVDDAFSQLQRCVEEGRGSSRPYAVVIIDLRFEKGYEGEDREVAGMRVLDAALKVPYLEAIILTAFPTVDTAVQAVAKGAFRYVIKGKSRNRATGFMEELGEAVRTAVENRRNMLCVGVSLRLLTESLAAIRSYRGKASLLGDVEEHAKGAGTAHEIIVRTRGGKQPIE